MERTGIPASTLDKIRDISRAICSEVAKVYMGSEDIPSAILTALIARGHVLIEGVPGVAKTTLAKAFSQVLGGSYRRVQFTPDLLPSDVTGGYVLDLRNNEFSLRKGPLFANVLLGDEINRAPAKTQSALLEAMQEGQVTIEGNTQELPSPFFVLATQNPIDQEGTYPLPEAQIDRFLIKLEMGYPEKSAELNMLATHSQPLPDVTHVVSPSDIENMQKLADSVFASPEILDYILELTVFTRRHSSVLLGASPRAGLLLLRACKAKALLSGRDFVLPDDVQNLLSSVFAHRILLQHQADMNGIVPQTVLNEALSRTHYRPGQAVSQ